MWKLTTPHAAGEMCYSSGVSALSVPGCLAVTTTLMSSFAISLPTVGSGRVQAVGPTLALYSQERHDGVTGGATMENRRQTESLGPGFQESPKR